MTNATRKRRGRDSERLVAGYLADNGWPYAEACAPGARGADITGVVDLAIEVKARRGLDLGAWIRQAERNADTRLPILVVRLDGQGPTNLREWPTVIPLGTLVELLHAAGYGDPTTGGTR